MSRTKTPHRIPKVASPNTLHLEMTEEFDAWTNDQVVAIHRPTNSSVRGSACGSVEAVHAAELKVVAAVEDWERFGIDLAVGAEDADVMAAGSTLLLARYDLLACEGPSLDDGLSPSGYWWFSDEAEVEDLAAEEEFVDSVAGFDRDFVEIVDFCGWREG